ncbi:leukocyte elastase inhibitor-like [Wyeomyia smithii]|uniref:leukocyte elastase inhibitor-like n=1 Tax=Wyeomyia smithii TaxID=174621 RepID=UPI002467C406|nr:leukocyte elastase inhibitor-like [Wyeomyia smithii]
MKWLIAISVYLTVVIAGPNSNKTIPFALDLFQAADHGDPEQNFIISPLSPQILLAQLAEGCSKLARDELNRVVRLSSDEGKQLTDALTEIANRNSAANKLDIASSIFKSDRLELSGKFKAARKTSQIPIVNVDFSNKNKAAGQINQWAKQMSRGNIPEIVTQDSLPNDAAMLLLNAIYFKGNWRYKFNETDTDRNGKFEASKGHTIPVQMMTQSNKLRHGLVILDDERELGLRWVELPYLGDELAMILMLPTYRHELDSLLKQLTPEHMEQIFNTIKHNYNPIKIHVKLPKFAIKNRVTLTEPLKKLGVKRIFEDNRALSEMFLTPTKVADAMQDVFLSIDEQGATATAVSAVTTINLSLNPYQDMDFTCDEPFAVFVVDKVNRVPLFMAKIRQPSSQ